MKKELLNNTEVKQAIAPQNDDGAAAIDGAIVDRTNFLSAIVHAAVGAVTGTPTDLDITFTIVEGDVVDDEDTPTSITDAAATTSVVTLAAVQAGSAEDFIDVDLTGFKKWIQIQAQATFTGGTTPTADIACALVLSDPRNSEYVTAAQN